MQTREDIFATLRDALVELFELEAERVTLDANLYQDLEIDSIDAVDLIDHIKRQTGKKLAILINLILKREKKELLFPFGQQVKAIYRPLFSERRF
jgi:acyl carrier protein